MYRSTLAGASLILLAVATVAWAAFDGDVTTTPDFNAMVAKIIAGIGLILAKDKLEP